MQILLRILLANLQTEVFIAINVSMKLDLDTVLWDISRPNTWPYLILVETVPKYWIQNTIFYDIIEEFIVNKNSINFFYSFITDSAEDFLCKRFKGENGIMWFCKICQFESRYKQVLVTHIEAKHMELSLPCRYCSKLCNTKHTLLRHERSHRK